MHRVPKRIAAGFVALAIAAPAALASSAPAPATQAVVHTRIERSGTVVVSGYDGGVPLDPGGR
jgi:hypothetical protein